MTILRVNRPAFFVEQKEVEKIIPLNEWTLEVTLNSGDTILGYKVEP